MKERTLIKIVICGCKKKQVLNTKYDHNEKYIYKYI